MSATKLVEGADYEIIHKGATIGIATFTGKYGGMLRAPIFIMGDEEKVFAPHRGYSFKKFVKGGRRKTTRKNRRRQSRRN
jgi:hypothetical protein